MIDMAGNMNDLMNLYQQMCQAPDKAQFFNQRFGVNIPQNMNNPNDVIQFCMNNGMFNQAQVNRAMSLKNNPLIQKIFR